MSRQLRTLVLDANGFYWKAIAADTVVQGLLRVRDYHRIPERLRHVRFIRGLTSRLDALSYTRDWRDALCASPALDVRVCNMSDLVDYAACLARIRRYDLLVVLHAAAGDSMSLLLRTAERFRSRSGRLAVFIGNEYDLMAEKMKFLRVSGADYVCTQLPIENARWLYARCGAEVLAMPHALNPARYHPPRVAERPLDIGFIGARFRYFIGDVERSQLIDAVKSGASRWGFTSEFRERNISASDWAGFLRRCKGTVGAESGTYYLDRDGGLLAAAKAFEQKHPEVSFDELYARFFAHPTVDYVSGKAVSSRHFEAIGTKTCQILLEGHYNGILEPEVHYIAVKKDLSDLDAAVERFRDTSYREQIVDRAFAYAMDSHTYAHRVGALLDAVG